MKPAARELCRAAAAVIALAATTVPAAHAENLADAWRMAIEHDGAYAAATAETERAASTERAARGSRWPVLAAGAGFTRFASAPQLDLTSAGFPLQAPLFPGDDFAAGNVQLSVPLFTSGRLTASIDAAHQGAVGAGESERAQLASLRLAVAESYVDVLRTRRLQRTAESSVTSLGAHAADVSSLVERELMPRSDLLAARVALANAEQARLRATNAAALARADYNRRLGEPLDRVPDLDESPRFDAQLGDEPLDSLLGRAREARAELAAMAAHTRALERQADAARADMLPQLPLSGAYTYLENQILDREDYTSIAIELRWNLFDGGQARNRSAALRSASRAAQRLTDDLGSRVELEVRGAWLEVREARARLAASREAVAQSEENLRISRELYRSELGTNTQVLDAVALQVAATHNHDDALLDELLAQLRLARAVGTL